MTAARTEQAATARKRRRVVRLKQRARQAWFQMKRVAARRDHLPDFIIIGAQRSGTTSLFNALASHPNVSPSVVKEVHYFDFNHHRGLNWYRRHFPEYPWQSAGRDQLRGEATPYYLYDEHVPARIAGDLPEKKLIAVLRNPIDRAYSDHQFQTRLGYETLPFEEALAAEDDRLAADDPARMDDPAYAFHSHHRRHGYMARGRYAEQLRRWFAAVDRDRLLLLVAEDFFLDMAGTLRRVEGFLGLPPVEYGKLKSYNSVKYSPMSGELRQWLRSRFSEDVAELRRMTDLTVDWDI